MQKKCSLTQFIPGTQPAAQHTTRTPYWYMQMPVPWIVSHVMPDGQWPPWVPPPPPQSSAQFVGLDEPEDERMHCGMAPEPAGALEQPWLRLHSGELRQR